ncbi:MAG: DUF1549 and DUF1553 domain-containing protein [Verrucomicrobiota bacterium]
MGIWRTVTLVPRRLGAGTPQHGVPTDFGILITKAFVGILALVGLVAPGLAVETVDSQHPKNSQHWAFVAPERPGLPDVRPRQWVRNPIDAFILAHLEKENIDPSPEADRAALIRRVSLDLTGLPPSISDVDAFLNDGRSDAYEGLVDRLLASPHYGERWGRWWLDAARYADSNGYSIDSIRSVWPYRDWVVRALNADLPFDEFTLWQLAGDLVPGAGLEQVIATGFHRNTQVNHEGGIDTEQFRIESAVDRVNTTATVWLGVTLGCAQCHNHKYDPFTQREYYRFFAFFNQQENDGHGSAALEAENTLDLGTPEKLAALAQHRKELKQREKELSDWIEKELKSKQAAWETALNDDAKKEMKPEVLAALVVTASKRNEFQAGTAFNAFRDENTEYQERRKVVDEFRKKQPKLNVTLVMKERSEPRETFVMVKGDFTRRGETVEAGVPAVLGELRRSEVSVLQGDSRRSDESSAVARSERAPKRPEGRALNRLDLARWLVSPENPLTARVIMNRVWQVYFGKGIVETENDFGRMGSPPSHPELLDWLATEFMERGWSLKAMHRSIVTSATYRQQSNLHGGEPRMRSVNRTLAADFDSRSELHDPRSVDPVNRLLWRQNRLRLDAELIRDVQLAASDLLVPRLGGPPVFPPQSEGLDAFTQNKREWKTSTGGDRYRRALYTHIQRTRFHPSLAVFDAPDAYTTCTRRLRSNTPLQALTLLNGQAFHEFAQGLAARIQAHAGNNDAKLEFGFRCCLARRPATNEKARLEQLLSDERKAGSEESAAWLTVARVLLNLDETITRE